MNEWRNSAKATWGEYMAEEDVARKKMLLNMMRKVSGMEIKCSNCLYDNEPMVGPHCALCGIGRKNWTPNENFVKYSISMFDRVIYNDPATIILWKDGTKTVVKCMEGEDYDPEKGFAMAVLKKLFGEDYGKVMKEFVKPELRKRERAAEQMTTFTFTGVRANSLREEPWRRWEEVERRIDGDLHSR